MSTYTVSVECPRCDTEMEIDVSLSGGSRHATRWQPAEAPDLDYTAPDGCTHEPDDDTEFTPGIYTSEEMDALYAKVEAAALQAHEDAAFDPKWDGPEE